MHHYPVTIQCDVCKRQTSAYMVKIGASLVARWEMPAGEIMDMSGYDVLPPQVRYPFTHCGNGGSGGLKPHEQMLVEHRRLELRVGWQEYVDGPKRLTACSGACRLKLKDEILGIGTFNSALKVRYDQRWRHVSTDEEVAKFKDAYDKCGICKGPLSVHPWQAANGSVPAHYFLKRERICGAVKQTGDLRTLVCTLKPGHDADGVHSLNHQMVLQSLTSETWSG